MANATETKTCRGCGAERPLDGFYKRKPYGYSSKCRECIREDRRQFRATDADRINATRRARYVPRGRTDLERFWAQVLKADDCWLWQASLIRGYGSFWADGRNVLAHRYIYEQEVGPIPEGMFILHSCDTPSCVNPAHLRVGDHLENMADMRARDRADRRPGRKHPMARLTAPDVAEIRRLRAAGLLQREIAEQFGISQSHVSSILRRRSWRQED